MDPRRFDQLTRTFARQATRRSVIGGLIAGIAATVRPRAAATAACIPIDASCEIGDECCDGYTCFEAICDCPSAIFDETGRCNPRGVGTCRSEGGACADNAGCCLDEGLTCQEGTCRPARTTEVVCVGVGQPCSVGSVCCGAPATTCSVDGVCTCAEPSFPDRTGSMCVVRCSFPEEPCGDDSPCCEGAGACVDGVCRCAEGLRACGATCVDPTVRYQRDEKNCGARGRRCGEGEICCEGDCVRKEALASDPGHCGSCCSACLPEQVCCDGRCAQPFSDPVSGDICCAPELVCAPGDGTELCCGVDETCHNGTCCRLDRICGDTCCGEGSTCHCGVCVVELETCDGDDGCCGQRCVDGVCCPASATCPDGAGGEQCCGVDQLCGGEPGTCLSVASSPAVYPVRTPRRPG